MKNMKKIAFISVLLLCVVVLVGCKAKQPEQPAITNIPGNEDTQPADTNDAEENTWDNEANDDEEQAANNAEWDDMEVAWNVAELAKCLSDNWVIMYWTEWCGHCKNQKALFGDSFAQVEYVDCDADRQKCLDAGVKGFPTWINQEGDAFPGTQTLARLAEIATCEYSG